MKIDYSTLSKEELDVLRAKQRIEWEETKDRQLEREQLIEMNQIIRAQKGVQYTPTKMCRFMVMKMCAFGLKNTQIAETIGISEKSLRNHFEEELRQGRIEVNYMVADTLFRQAMAGNTAALIFWCKTRLQWSEPPAQHEHSFQKGGSVTPKMANTTKLDGAEIAATKAILYRSGSKDNQSISMNGHDDKAKNKMLLGSNNV